MAPRATKKNIVGMLNGHEVVRMKLADLKPAPYNPRTITDAALDGLGESLKRFGDLQPIIYNKRTSHVVGGHQRLAAKLKAGEQDADIIVIDVDELVEKQINIALNSPHIQGEFDDVKLEELLGELRVADLPTFEALKFEDFGFDLIGDPNDGAPPPQYPSRFEITVMCEDEADQKKLYEQLVNEGRRCTILQLYDVDQE